MASRIGTPQQSAIVAETAATFGPAIKAGKDLEQLFYTSLTLIAQKSQARKTDQTGLRRDTKELFNPTTITYLQGPDQAYQERLLHIFQSHLSKMEHTVKEFQQTELLVPKRNCLGKDSRFDLSIITEKNIHQFATKFSFEDYTRICSLAGYPPKKGLTKETLSIRDFGELFSNKEVMQKLKAASPEEYKKLRLAITISHIRQDRPEQRKSDWALLTIRSEIDGKMYPLSQYLTWLYRDFIKDPIERMKGHSFVTILHQDPLLIEHSLGDIGKIFKEALQWNGRNLQTLKEQVGFLRYKFTHAMPFMEKNEEILSLLEKAIYFHHGYELKYNEKKRIDLEAFTSSPAQFVANYATLTESPEEPNWMIQLETEVD